MEIEFSVKDGIATIVLNRPAAMNSITEELCEQLVAALRRVDEDNDILVAILTGAGERAFCTGSDLKLTPPPPEGLAVRKYGDHPGPAYDHLHPRLWREFQGTFMKLDKPLIAAINGYALAGGLEFALLCDVRIAAEHAKFGLTEVKIGSIPGLGGTQRLPRTIAQSHAMLMLLTGDHIDAQEALRFGLVSRVVPSPDLMAEANAIAARMAANGPMSLRAIKQSVRMGLEMSLDHALDYEFTTWGLLRGTDDYKEGRRAFAEKRRPAFRSR